MRRSLSLIAAGVMVLLAAAAPQANAPDPIPLRIDLNAEARPFPHFWERIFGSGRANLSLRESYRRDLRMLKSATAVEYIRFHAIFHDENGVYDEDANGRPVYNWSYVDQIYDGLLAEGVRPFVELSFMPRKMASREALHPFWYKQNVAPPRDWSRWGELVERFTRHVTERYGADEVARWYFEVWNEPNIDFWAGEPKYDTYLRLYAEAARAVKRVDARYRVGGPGTAQAAWVDRFLKSCQERNLPVDFASTHVYANDTAQDVFGKNETITRRDMTPRAVRKVYEQVRRSPFPALPIHWTEYNASYKNEVEVTDSAFMGPWLANLIREADGQVTTMSYWTFSDVFEEQGIVKTPFYGGYGLIAAGNIPKPAFNAFRLLNRLGTLRLAASSDSVLVTRRRDGSHAIAVWNYAEPGAQGAERTYRLDLAGGNANARLHATVIDPEHGSALAAWEKMGRPAFPTREQQAALQKAAELPPSAALQGNLLRLRPHSLALIEAVR